jgi:hypothetical protein
MFRACRTDISILPCSGGAGAVTFPPLKIDVDSELHVPLSTQFLVAGACNAG